MDNLTLKLPNGLTLRLNPCGTFAILSPLKPCFVRHDPDRTLAQGPYLGLPALPVDDERWMQLCAAAYAAWMLTHDLFTDEVGAAAAQMEVGLLRGNNEPNKQLHEQAKILSEWANEALNYEGWDQDIHQVLEWISTLAQPAIDPSPLHRKFGGFLVKMAVDWNELRLSIPHNGTAPDRIIEATVSAGNLLRTQEAPKDVMDYFRWLAVLISQNPRRWRHMREMAAEAREWLGFQQEAGQRGVVDAVLVSTIIATGYKTSEEERLAAYQAAGGNPAYLGLVLGRA